MTSRNQKSRGRLRLSCADGDPDASPTNPDELTDAPIDLEEIRALLGQHQARTPRTIMITGTIDEDTVAQVGYQLAMLAEESAHEPVFVKILSDGGQLSAGFALVDLFRTNDSPVITIALGVASAAAIAFEGGDIRAISPNATVVIHNPKMEVAGHASAEDFADGAKEMKEANERIARFFAKCTGQPVKRIRSWLEEEKRFSAEEAVRSGFADTILETRPLPRRRRRK